jgi:hypothetical protein
MLFMQWKDGVGHFGYIVHVLPNVPEYRPIGNGDWGLSKLIGLGRMAIGQTIAGTTLYGRFD